MSGFECSQFDFRDDIEKFKEFAEPLYDKYRTMVKNYDLLSRVYTIKTLFMEEYSNFLKTNNIFGERKNVMDAMIRPFRTFWEFEWGGDWKDVSLSKKMTRSVFVSITHDAFEKLLPRGCVGSGKIVLCQNNSIFLAEPTCSCRVQPDEFRR